MLKKFLDVKCSSNYIDCSIKKKAGNWPEKKIETEFVCNQGKTRRFSPILKLIQLYCFSIEPNHCHWIHQLQHTEVTAKLFWDFWLKENKCTLIVHQIHNKELTHNINTTSKISHLSTIRISAVDLLIPFYNSKLYKNVL